MSNNSCFKVGCIQNTASIEISANISDCSEQIRQAVAKGAQLVCTPEYFLHLDVDDQAMLAASYPEQSHPGLAHFRQLAQALDVWLLLGSLSIRCGEGRFNNRSYLLDNSGEIVTRYDKLHLFDVDLADGECYRESACVTAGDQLVLADTPWGRLGLSVCYDLRFAYQYRGLAQAGADFLTIPAAFTQTTGKAHWHVLVRARAIETGCYVFAPCQGGVHHGERRTFGHSLIVDPWGEVLAEGGDDPGVIVAEIAPARVQQSRSMIPALQHDRTPVLI